jgi:hypothetical protein
MAKQTSSAISSLAARVLKGYKPRRDEIEAMAASLLTQDETKGQKPVLAGKEGGPKPGY